MATITLPNVFSSGGTIFASEHNDNFSTIYNDYNGNITNVNISASAAIVDTKLATITTANKVNVSAITGTLGVANGGTGVTTITDGGVMIGQGTSAIASVDLTTDGAIVIGDGASTPTSLAAFTSATGTLKHEQGGVEADISAVALGGLVTGTGSGTMGLLTVGSNGTIPVADSGESNGIKYNAGVFLVGSSEVSATATTVNITIEDDKQYYCVFSWTGGSGTNNLYIQFNDDTSGSNYRWSFSNLPDTSATPTEVYVGSNGADSTGARLYQSGGGEVAGGSFLVNSDNAIVASGAVVRGDYYAETTGNTTVMGSFVGRYNGGNVTSVQMHMNVVSGTTGDWNFYVYEISK